MTADEFKAKWKGYKPNKKEIPNMKLADAIDYAEHWSDLNILMGYSDDPAIMLLARLVELYKERTN